MPGTRRRTWGLFVLLPPGDGHVRRFDHGGAGRCLTASTHPTLEESRRLILPLALAQFICSFAGSNMNVMINDISEDLDTTVQGIQVAITLFLLVMAALMIPGGKLTDRYGRKRCFTVGLPCTASAPCSARPRPGSGVLILGNSILEGVGTALLIPPVYILTTLLFTEVTSRARAFGAISAMGGIGAAAGPLIGGLITSAISWRAAFVFQAAGHRADRAAEPAARRPAAGRPRPGRFDTGRRRPVGARPGPASCWASWPRTTTSG